MTRETFGKGIVLLTEAFPERFAEIDEPGLEIWYSMLKDIPDNPFETTVLYICRNHKKPPVIATIREMANQINLQHLSSEEAWLKVTETARMQGRTASTKEIFANDPALERTVRALGWKNICDSTVDGMSSLRAHFYRTYEAMKLRVNLDAEIHLIEYLKEDKIQEGEPQPVDAPSKPKIQH